MKEKNEINAPRVESNENPVAIENVKNVVINFESDEIREAEARALKSREAEASDATEARKNAAALMQSARDVFSAARQREEDAKINAARSRAAAGSESAADREIISIDVLNSFSSKIRADVEKRRAEIEATPEAKAANKAIRDNNKKTSLFRALRDLGKALDLYNAKFSLYGFSLEESELTPALMMLPKISPLMLSPTADGAKVATLRRGKLTPVAEWTPDRVAAVLIDNELIKASAAAAPRAAILSALNARDNVATLQSVADQIAATLEDRKARAAGLNRTIKNPKAKDATKARAAADLEALNAEISTYNAKLSKALEDVKKAKADAAALRAAALKVAEIAAEDFDVIASRRDVLNVAKADAAEALRVAGLEISRAVAFAASEARKAKKALNADRVAALKKADPRDVFAAPADSEIFATLEALRVYAAADVEKASDAARVASDKAKIEAAARDAESVVIAESIKADPAAKYAALLEIACNAMKAARDAKAKKYKAADPKQTPEISDRDLFAAFDESAAADANARAALEALNAESPTVLMLEAREAREAAEASQRPAADAGSQPAAAAV